MNKWSNGIIILLVTEMKEDLVHLEYMENELIQWLGTKVRIARKGKRGKIVIEFYSPDELERIIEKIKGINGQSRI